ncbi:hypothetical protein BXZ70DRAFT_990020 [Cristinia sonorae]|uniref:Fungal-type protein kinase domain-containing protein n=1 Tax=Cristinia sonorae TaxID=1940300 RepID=A0A8K0ULV6_9AGAR|nr:hypothetical protein BXZ70DRAFT_990020 [Cristinia sonorae]
MHGLWVGPLKVSEFMDAFMKTTKRLPRSRLAKVKFTSVPTISASEHDMSHSFIDVVGKHGLLPSGWVLRETMGGGKAGKKDEPRMLLCNEEPGASGSHWKSAEMWIDINPTAEMDAFRTDVEDLSTSLDDVTEDAKRTRRRITSYTANQLARQHRTSTLSLLICGHHARFIRWDRSGAVVSHHFDYRAEPLPLAEFFWRYGQLSRAERGFDTTARLATCIEESRLHAAISTHLSDPTKRRIPKMRQTMDLNFPIHVISLFSPASPQEYVVQRPFSPPDSPVGRCTRAYIALDLASGELIFLKDYWRPSDETRPPEAEIYTALDEARIPHLPHVRFGGDVSRDDDPDSTATQTWLDVQGLCAHGTVKEYLHHRIVQDLAYPLTTVDDSRELVVAARDVLKCILHAHENGWMHRDVSTGNMMLNAHGQGILNDWDHGLQIDPNRQQHPPRTGTWQFLSIMLSANPKKVQDVLDDIESCYWVLMYNALHYFENTADQYVVDMFDYHEDNSGENEMIGGGRKLFFLVNSDNISFSCAPLHALVHELREYFKMLYVNYAEAVIDEIGPSLLAIFETALSRVDWATSDVLPDQFPNKQGRVDPITLPRHKDDSSSPPRPNIAHAASRGSSQVPCKRSRDDHDDHSATGPSRTRTRTQSSKRQRTEPSLPPRTQPVVGGRRRQLDRLGSSGVSANRRATRSQTRSSQRITRSQSKRIHT